MSGKRNPTANAMYRQYRNSGGTLKFSDWISREKAKGFQNFTGGVMIPVNKPLTDSLDKTLASMRGTPQTKLENKYVLGIHRNAWIGVGIAAVVITGIIIYRKNAK